MLEIRNLSKTYNGDIKALQGIDLQIPQGQFVAILGRSGAGKSTLIRSINGLVKPDSGEVQFQNIRVNQASKKELLELRKNIGMIFQQFNLIDRLDVLTNVLTGRLGQRRYLLTLLGCFDDRDYLLAREALIRVGLINYENHLARNLSGGQQQRVAIARALVQQPQLILGDEPVASLDPITAKEILQLLRDISVQEGITVVLNMHAVDLALDFAQRVIGIKEGRVVYDGAVEGVTAQVLGEIYG